MMARVPALLMSWVLFSALVVTITGEKDTPIVAELPVKQMTLGKCPGEKEGLVVVSLLDGSLQAYGAKTGTHVWSIDFARPLATSWSADGWPEVLPSADGGAFYVDAETDELIAIDENTHLRDKKGSRSAVFLSYHERKALYIDRCSGKVLRVLSYHSDPPDPLEKCAEAKAWGSEKAGLDGDSDVIILSSVETGIRLVEPATGMQVGNGSVLHFNPLLYQHGKCLPGKKVRNSASLQLEVAQRRDQIRMFDPRDGSLLWSKDLSSLAVEAHGLNGVKTRMEAPKKALGDERAEDVGAGPLPQSDSQPKLLSEADRSLVLIDQNMLAKSFTTRFRASPNAVTHVSVNQGEQQQDRGLLRAPSLIEILIAFGFCGTLIVGLLILFRGSTTRTHEFRAVNMDEKHPGSSERPIGGSSDRAGAADATPGRADSEQMGSNGAEDQLRTSHSSEVVNEPGDGSAKKKKKKKKKVKAAEADDRNDIGAAAFGGAVVGKTTYGEVPTGWFVVGRICVSPKVLGVGSHGTVVYEGMLQPGDRPIAVKRLLRYLYEAAGKEIQLLISLDENTQNVVRYFAMEEDQQFIYLALELCAGTLGERVGEKEPPALRDEDAGRAFPPYAIGALRDLVVGLVNLHRAGVVHRDLKPQNVLLTRGDWRKNEIQVKIGDVGLATQLEADRSSYSLMTGAGAIGTVGWRAPEVLRGERQTKSVDVFSAGLIIYYVLTMGTHPFGNQAYERDIKILNWDINLSGLDDHPEALDLVTKMIVENPPDRVTAEQAQFHPLFWPDARKLALLTDVADKLQDSRVLNPSDNLCDQLLAVDGVDEFNDWQLKLDMHFLKHLGRTAKSQRAYENNILGLLRVIRNKKSHYGELNADVQKILGSVPAEGAVDTRHNYFRYFADRFKNLFMVVYRFARSTADICRDSSFSVYNLDDTFSRVTVEEQVEELNELERRASLKPSASKKNALEPAQRIVRSFEEMVVFAKQNKPVLAECTLKKLRELKIYDSTAQLRWRTVLTEVPRTRQSATQEKYRPPAQRNREHLKQTR